MTDLRCSRLAVMAVASCSALNFAECLEQAELQGDQNVGHDDRESSAALVYVWIIFSVSISAFLFTFL